MPTSLKKNQDINDNDFKNNLLNEIDPKTESQSDLIEIDKPHHLKTLDEEFAFEEIDSKSTPKPRKRFSIGKILSAIIIVISIVLLSFGGYVAYSLASVGEKSLGQGENMNLFDQTKQIIGTILNPNKRVELKGESDGRTNFLLLGTDVAAGLTDTIMIASYYHNEKKLVTVNIPRDTLAFDGYETQKINGVYAAAANRTKDKENKEAVGAEYLASILGKEFGIPIHYWAKINFLGVKQVVDELGGVDVDVENSFTDCEYPTDNYSGYIRPCPTFKAGTQKMNGTTALIYARSRHSGNNGEGSDFARGKRQSILTASILQAIKTKNVFENVTKISSYLSIIGGNFKTSLKLDEMYSLSQLIKDVDIKNNFLRIQWATGNGFLCTGANPEQAYTITYCGGAVIGKTQVSVAKQKGKDSVQNLLKTAEQGTLLDADVALISNQSTDLSKIRTEFEKAGFNNITFSNANKDIPAIKKGALQTRSFYIIDPQLKELYNKLSKKPDVGVDIQTELPAGYVLPKGLEDAKIIVIVK